MMRLQILGDPALMHNLRQVRARRWRPPRCPSGRALTATQLLFQNQPELAQAAATDPAQFERLLRQTQHMYQEAELAKQREAAQLNEDPFDVEAQRRIEEAIRQEQVMENLRHALEYLPESFGKVTML